MKYKFFAILFLMLTISSCNQSEKDKTDLPINFINFRMLALQAAGGDSVANRKLSYFINPKTDETYTNILIDVYPMNERNKFYYVLIEYPNPLYNRFAVFDSYLNLHLVDKSLNGNLSYENGSDYIKIKDSFLSKDIISLHRISFYKIDTTSVRLVLRTYEQIMTPALLITQDVIKSDKDTIFTKILSPMLQTIAPADTFIFNADKDKFLSRNNFVEKIILNEVNNFIGGATLPELKEK